MLVEQVEFKKQHRKTCRRQKMPKMTLTFRSVFACVDPFAATGGAFSLSLPSVERTLSWESWVSYMQKNKMPWRFVYVPTFSLVHLVPDSKSAFSWLQCHSVQLFLARQVLLVVLDLKVVQDPSPGRGSYCGGVVPPWSMKDSESSVFFGSQKNCEKSFGFQIVSLIRNSVIWCRFYGEMYQDIQNLYI